MRSFVLLVQPTGFFANPVTCEDNYFQAASSAADNGRTARDAGIAELAALHRALEARGVLVRRVPLSSAEGGDTKPDAIFPNNSLSLHVAPAADGRPSLQGVLWPMSPGRVDEVPASVITAMSKACATFHDLRHVQDMPALALSSAAGGTATDEGFVALEGTGALVFGPGGDACFMARSQRGQEAVLRLLSSLPGARTFQSPTLQQVHLFDGVDRDGRTVYHTNVLGWVGTKAAAWCLEGMRFAVEDASEDISYIDQRAGAGAPHFLSSKKAFTAYFEQRGITLVPLSFDEMHSFAGNCLELFDGAGNPFVAMSAAAWEGLSPSSKTSLEFVYGADGFVVVPTPAIEALGGGSVRCLQAHINFDAHCSEPIDTLTAALADVSLPVTK